MGLREELEDRRVAGQKCMTCLFVAGSDDAAEWRELLADDNIETPRLHRLARSKGFTGGLSAISNHRREHTA